MRASELLSKPPLNVLLNIDIARRKSPWEISISELLELFLSAIKTEVIDMRAAGTAVLSSATIYRLKVETLFFFEKLRQRQSYQALNEPPQIIVMPFRYEVYTTTLEELFDELIRIIEQTSKQESEQSSYTSMLEQEQPVLEDFVQSLQVLFVEFRKILRERLSAEGRIMLSELLSGLDPVSAARVFILLLFSASNGEVIIEQEEGQDDALIISVGQIE